MKKILFFSLITAIISACQSDKKATSDEGAQVVNVYSHRHYEADRALYDLFEKETGIKVNVVDASADEIITRLEAEGAKSPADVIITVDAGRLHRAEERDLLRPFPDSDMISRVPEHLRAPNNSWIGITTRARVIAYSRERVNPSEIVSYSDLASPPLRGKLLSRKSDNIYNQSLMASVVAMEGEEEAAAFVRGMVGNFARDPKGNDRDQIREIASGAGDLALVNTYYMGLMANSDEKADRDAYAKVGIIFPNQNDRGTHINISGIGFCKHSPNPENALRFAEFMLSPGAQQLLAEMNCEFPVISDGVRLPEVMQAWEDFQADELPMAKVGAYLDAAVDIMIQNGWK